MPFSKSWHHSTSSRGWYYTNVSFIILWTVHIPFTYFHYNISLPGSAETQTQSLISVKKIKNKIKALTSWAIPSPMVNFQRLLLTQYEQLQSLLNGNQCLLTHCILQRISIFIVTINKSEGNIPYRVQSQDQ